MSISTGRWPRHTSNEAPVLKLRYLAETSSIFFPYLSEHQLVSIAPLSPGEVVRLTDTRGNVGRALLPVQSRPSAISFCRKAQEKTRHL